MVILTEEDRKNIREVWSLVYQDPEGNGAVVVMRLFTDHPETKSYFKNFKNIETKEEMESNPRIKLHGMRVMEALNQVIVNMDNWDAVTTIFTPLAEKHRDVYQIHLHNYKLLFGVIIKVFKEALGTAFTDAACDSWNKVFQLLYDFMESSYEGAEDS
ncbi:cytoglobin-1 [Amia ocellicauda]|uniref:cytoglobin-1 n=1 Tax=Amia ocellicauda TaxID=2972642 RepID=UPI003464205E